VTEDNAAVKRTSTPGIMILEVMSMTCAHPKNTSLGVAVVYSHRYYPGQADPSFGEKAAQILSSVEFLDP